MGRKSKEKNLFTPFRDEKSGGIKEKRGGKGKRKSREISLKNTIKIYCNSQKTEPNYFEEIKELVRKEKILDIKIEVSISKNKGLDPLGCVKYAINDPGEYKEKWVVFDKDHFEIGEAIRLAEETGINVAWSNEAFELWLLMHFNYISTPLHRSDCLKKVSELLKKEKGFDYAKNEKGIFKLLRGQSNIAIRNAKKRHQIARRDKISPQASNPCTTVYILIERLLNSLKK